MKANIWLLIIQAVAWLALIGVGIWYLYQAIPSAGHGAPYVSLPKFLDAIGAADGDIGGCFLCPYISQLFAMIARATETLWGVIVGHTWILLAVGLIIFMFWRAFQIIMDANKQNATIGTDNRTFHFDAWWKDVRGQFIRVLAAGAMMGAVGLGGGAALKGVADAVIYPVMGVGTSLAMAASQSPVCAAGGAPAHAMAGVEDSFVCVVGNINAVVLHGASTGFAMMGLSAQGLAGGIMTWLAGLAVVLLFLYIGFNVVFKILNVIMNLVFLIIFLPLFLASWAFDKTWTLAGGVMKNAIGILAQTAVRVVGITIEVVIISSMVGYAQKSMTTDPVAEAAIIQKCEAASDYKACFVAERALHPGTFGYLDRGWDFLITMLFLFFVYKLLIEKKLQGIIDTSDKGAYFKFGDAVLGTGKSVWRAATQLLKKIPTGKK